MGKSRFLDTLAAPFGDDGSGRQVKEEALTELSKITDQQDYDRQIFVNRISKAIGLCATFNGSSRRIDDLDLIPDAVEALSMRFLWGYFCDTTKTTWTLFTRYCANSLVSTISLERTIRLILNDINQDQDIIMCIDELMLAQNGCPCQDITNAAKKILSALVHFLDREPRVHVVVSSLLYSSLQNFLTGSGRAVTCISLPAISKDHFVNIVNDIDTTWLSNNSELEGNMGGTVKDVILQGLIDSGGHPRLLENVVGYFQKKSKGNALTSASLENLHVSLWDFSVAKSCEASLPAKLLDALKLMCSGKVHHISELDPFISCGLLLQSANQMSASYALMPPLLIGMLYVHERNNNSKDLSFQILKACHQFMVLDTLASRAATAGDFFEKLTAHLLRLRLLLLVAHGFRTFTLKDLLTLDGAINHEHWCNKGNLTFEMPPKEEAVFSVSTISATGMHNAVEQGCPCGGAIYIAECDQNEAFDILIHLPGSAPLIAIQSRFSKAETKNPITNAQVQKCLENFQKFHPNLASKAPAFVVMAFRQAGARLSPQNFAGSNVKMSKACKQVAVLVKEDVMNIIPYSMQERPQLSSASNSM